MCAFVHVGEHRCTYAMAFVRIYVHACVGVCKCMRMCKCVRSCVCKCDRIRGHSWFLWICVYAFLYVYVMDNAMNTKGRLDFCIRGA